MKRKADAPDEEYQVVWLIGGSVSFSQRYGGYEPAWREFSRLSRATGTERTTRETVFRVRRRGEEWKEAARCVVGPRPDEPPMPRVVVSSEWGSGTAEDAAYADEAWLVSEIFDALVERYSDPSGNNVKSVRWEAVGGKVVMEWKRMK